MCFKILVAGVLEVHLSMYFFHILTWHVLMLYLFISLTKENMTSLN